MSHLGQVPEALFPFPCRPRSNTPSGGQVGGFFGPGRLQRPPRGPQDGLRYLHDGPREALEAPRRPKRPPREAKMAPRRLQGPPRRPKRPPRGPPTGTQEAKTIDFPEAFEGFSGSRIFAPNTAKGDGKSASERSSAQGFSPNGGGPGGGLDRRDFLTRPPGAKLAAFSAQDGSRDLQEVPKTA